MSHLGQFLYREHICNPSLKKLISRDKRSSSTLQSNWRMGNTQSMSHPPFFVSEPNLTPSDKKLGCAALYVYMLLGISEADTNSQGSTTQFLRRRLHIQRSAKMPPMGSTWRTSHWWHFLLAAVDVCLIVRNYSLLPRIRSKCKNKFTKSKYKVNAPNSASL